ncbi:hypothetical protein EJD97_018315 [Solanum chilense]|uniref:Uncharacterized protein n=1 Tax=Solanum chilense TaxID=4083 RepID=A0A6N2C7F4_SOLCI|nr:hypothetical protein EJD97_018315 [Solanum chilense]
MKMKDPVSFTVQITIVQSIHARGLCYLGASINLMPTSLYKKLGLGSPKPTTVDFVVLNFKEDPEVPFILGKQFLATGKAMIDVVAVQLTVRSHDKVEVFDVYIALNIPPVYEEAFAITVVDLEVDGKHIFADDPLERVMRGDDIYGDAE